MLPIDVERRAYGARLPGEIGFGEAEDRDAALGDGGEMPVAGQEDALFGDAAGDDLGVAEPAFSDRRVMTSGSQPAAEPA